MIGHTVMDVWRFCFRGFFFFSLHRCIIHHRTTVPFERECHETHVVFPLRVEESLKVLLSDWELNWWSHALQFWSASLKGLDRGNVLKVKNSVKQVLQFLPIWRFYYSQSESWYPGKQHHATRQRLLIIYLLMSVYSSLFPQLYNVIFIQVSTQTWQRTL